MENKRRRKGFEKYEKSNTLDSPISLLSQCITYVADHLDYVDTFFGLPDLIGEQIFDEAEKWDKFDISCCNCYQNLSLFVTVYDELVLSTLNLSYQYLGLNYCQGHLQLFSSLKELDVTGCKLDDYHDFLTYVGQLECLENLILRKNEMSDIGIQRLTTPYRVCHRGPKNLQKLDLSENWNITAKSERYLKQFIKLTEIDVTGTQIKGNPDLLKFWKFKPCKEKNELSRVENSGWAKDVVMRWMRAAVDRITTIKVTKDLTQTQKFYSRKRNKISEPFKTDNLEEVKIVPGYRLLLIRINSAFSSIQSTGSGQNKLLNLEMDV